MPEINWVSVRPLDLGTPPARSDLRPTSPDSAPRKDRLRAGIRREARKGTMTPRHALFFPVFPVILITVSALLVPERSEAQEVPTAHGPGSEAALVESAELVHRAELLLASPKRSKQAARIFERAATLHHPEDPYALELLERAVAARWAGGDRRRARRTLEQLGERRLEGGDVVGASFAFYRVAIVASAEGDGERALRYLQKSYRLAASPLLSDEERSTMMRWVPEDRPRIAASRDPR